MRIFVSYPRADGRELALRLHEDLRRRGHQPWLDTSSLRGGADWEREIREQIDSCDLLLAVISRGSSVAPVCEAEQMRAIRKHKRIVPILVHKDADRLLHLEKLHHHDFSDPRRYEERFRDLVQDLERPTEASAAGRLVGTSTTPPLPAQFVPRPDDMMRLQRAVLADSAPGVAPVVALQGLGGTGKTVLAAAVCRDSNTLARFPDGVIWLKIGPHAGAAAAQMRALADALHDCLDGYGTSESARVHLCAVLRGKPLLLVLDDVWDPRQAEPFLAVEQPSKVLITTRGAGVGLPLGAVEIRLGPMTGLEAEALLRNWPGRGELELGDIANRAGCIPLALRLAGAQLRQNVTAREWLNSVRHTSQLRLTRCGSDPRDSVELCFDLSVLRLPESDRRLYYALSIFPDGVPAPERVIVRLWRELAPEFDGEACRDVLAELFRQALIERGPGGDVTLHDLLRDYTRRKLGSDYVQMHQALLRVFNPSGTTGWHQLVDEDYLPRYLAWHLKESGRIAELRALAADFDWLRFKAAHMGAWAVTADADYLPDDTDLKPLQAALRLSSHGLARGAGQLASQLLGRMRLPCPEPGDRAAPHWEPLLNQARNWRGEAWLRPLTCSLTPPGRGLVHMLPAHQGKATALAVAAEGRLMASASADGTVRVWEIRFGRELASIRAHSLPVCAVEFDARAEHVICGSADHAISVWEWRSARRVMILKEHQGPVTALAVFPGDGRLVSASTDKTLRVWDVQTGKRILPLAGHEDWVNTVAVTADGKRIVSGSDDQTARVWDSSSGLEILCYSGDESPVRAVVIAEDGRTVLSASEDGGIRVWDLFNGKDILILRRNGRPTTALCFADHGRSIVTGDSVLRLWDSETGRQLDAWTAVLHSLAVTPDSRRLLAGADDGALLLWDLETGGKRQLAAHDGSVRAVAISPDGGLAAAASWDWTVRTWDLEKGTESACRVSDGGCAWCVAFSSCGHFLVSGHSDGSVHVWDAGSTERIATFVGDSPIYACAVASDGRTILAGEKEGRLHFLRLELPE